MLNVAFLPFETENWHSFTSNLQVAIFLRVISEQYAVAPGCKAVTHSATDRGI